MIKYKNLPLYDGYQYSKLLAITIYDKGYNNYTIKNHYKLLKIELKFILRRPIIFTTSIVRIYNDMTL